MDAPNHLPRSPLLLSAVGSLSDSTRRQVELARTHLSDRQYHVERGNEHAAHHRTAVVVYLTLVTDRSRDITRPHWLHPWLHTGLKVVLAGAEISAGTAALYVGGDPLPLALLTFSGVSVATVLAGSNIGIQVRRREQRHKGGLIKAALLSVALATAMLAVYRYFTLGPLFGTLAFVTTMVAFGSAFLAYLWDDMAADEIQRAHDLCRTLNRQTRRHHQHRVVRRFEAAEAALRLGAADALHQAERQLHRVPSPFARATGAISPDPVGPVPASPVGPTLADGPIDGSTVDELLVLVAGPDILHLTPKTSLDPLP